ncbi:acetyltransferase [Odoribacter lunatus]|uniref:acetyltransferase n=1 Tax=Odoribacter lunatus TaxID=2941335 RepID=UPI002040E805|nr:acetyltransferase [Odoribacter lunatus]
MKNLYIIGARGFGREIYHLATQTNEYLKDFQIAGFLDDKKDALNGYDNYPPIVSSVEDYNLQEDDVFICALGDVRYKKKYVEMIQKKGGKFFTLVHPTSYISGNTILGEGCIVCAYTRISCDAIVGSFNTFQPFTAIGHDVRIGDFNHFNTYSFLGGFVEIKNSVTLHTGAIVHPHKKVEDNSIVGAGCVVLRNVKSNCTVYGNPAKTLTF